MRYIYLCLVSLIATFSFQAGEIYIPESFQNGERIEQVILISDVDGVVREGVEALADPRVVAEIKSLLCFDGVDVTFISGTPVDNDSSLELWRKGNIPLTRVFGSNFNEELSQEKVAIFGTLSGHRMKSDGSVDVIDEYDLETSFVLSRFLLETFLKEVEEGGSYEQRVLATSLKNQLQTLQLKNKRQSRSVTAEEYYPFVQAIRTHFDPDFRIINNGALVETHSSYPEWKTSPFFSWLQHQLDESHSLAYFLAPHEKRMATGVAKRGDRGLNYLLISKTNKGIATKKHIEEKLRQYPQALIITIGDTQVDFPMHQNAHLAFHVGMEKVWRDNPLPQCMMVRDREGNDVQHIEGTLKVLNLLKEALGKSFADFKYIPQKDALGNWDFYSIHELKGE
jgi:hypothetical protein